ncbi:hypothetical protein HYQ44_017852 [Verticillium longisporum]|nr:hypothetical protein HYQ44_017852 [Verticillium longisporum]
MSHHKVGATEGRNRHSNTKRLPRSGISAQYSWILTPSYFPATETPPPIRLGSPGPTPIHLLPRYLLNSTQARQKQGCHWRRSRSFTGPVSLLPPPRSVARRSCRSDMSNLVACSIT